MATVHDGHRERMRQRFLAEGGSNFQDHELLEMLLYYVVTRANTNEQAHKMIQEFGSLSMLMEADPYDISRLCNVKLPTAILMSLQREISIRCAQEKLKVRPVLDSVQKSKEYCTILLNGRLTENFYVVCLDARKRVTHFAKIAEGTIQQAVVHPRMVMEAVIKYRAASVILAHNHPDGTCRPSFSDIELTNDLRNLLKQIDVDVVDHLIVAENEAYSFVENGFLKE
ncbi:JAB domain-containing protein [Chakrabartyella piscis]|uniref:JAB domain-containing protein n=1 Tax=Chakrabartyella piscis TaxID=2918914 RepID=UPI002958D58E|nr:DNA repair protein RadC [Chakrabartyella piscis]